MVEKTGQRNTDYSLGDLLQVSVLPGAIVRSGTLVVFDLERRGCQAAANRAGTILVGVGFSDADNRSGGTGAQLVLRRRGRFLFDYAQPLSDGDLFRRVYAADDCTVATSDVASEGPYVGIITGFKDDQVWVEIDPAIMEAVRK